MESNCITWKSKRWAFILHEYKFDIVHKVGKVNWDAKGLSQNPSFNEEDTIN
jgi:hypothetical protein